MADKYTAVWVSHSSISDYLKCPRLYFLRNVYRDPKTGHKIQITSPALALGMSVHEVVESLSILPTDKRFSDPLLGKFDAVWKKVSGKKGGFLDTESEERYKKRGEAMIQRVINHPGPISRLAIKIKEDLPQFWLSEEDGIILCGKIDWLEYLPDSDSVHIIDFKTSKKEEDGNSLQLPIYHLLVHECQKRKVSKASYWYLDFSDELVEKSLPDLEDSRKKILEIAKEIKLMRQLERFKCKDGNGCQFCTPFEKVIRGEGELVGINDYNQDLYILGKGTSVAEDDSIIL